MPTPTMPLRSLHRRNVLHVRGDRAVLEFEVLVEQIDKVAPIRTDVPSVPAAPARHRSRSEVGLNQSSGEQYGSHPMLVSQPLPVSSRAVVTNARGQQDHVLARSIQRWSTSPGSTAPAVRMASAHARNEPRTANEEYLSATTHLA